METPTIYVRQDMVLPDNDQWQFRFSVESESSDRLYTIAQHKKNRDLGCSCPGWKRNRHCKHLQALGILDRNKYFLPFDGNRLQTKTVNELERIWLAHIDKIIKEAKQLASACQCR